MFELVIKSVYLVLVKMHANKREEIASVHAGDIAAMVGVKDSITGDTLCARRAHGSS